MLNNRWFCFFCMLLLSVVLPSPGDNQRNLEELGVAGDFSNLSDVHSGYIVQLKKRWKPKQPWVTTSFPPKFHKSRQLLVQVPPLPFDVTIRFLIEPLCATRDIEFVFGSNEREFTQKCKKHAVQEVSAVLRTKRDKNASRNAKDLPSRISVWAESPNMENGRILLFAWEATPWRSHNRESDFSVFAAHIENTAVVHVCRDSHTPTILQPLVTLALQPKSKKRKSKQTDSNVPAKRQRIIEPIPMVDSYPTSGMSIAAPLQQTFEQEEQFTSPNPNFSVSEFSVSPTLPVLPVAVPAPEVREQEYLDDIPVLVELNMEVLSDSLDRFVNSLFQDYTPDCT